MPIFRHARHLSPGPNGSILAAGGGRLFGIVNDKVHLLDNEKSTIRALAFDRKTQDVFVATENVLWKAPAFSVPHLNGQISFTHAVGEAKSTVSMAVDNSTADTLLYACEYSANRVKVIRVRDGKVMRTIDSWPEQGDLEFRPESVAVDNSGNVFVWNNGSLTILAWNRDGRFLGHLNTHCQYPQLISCVNDYLVVAGGDNQDLVMTKEGDLISTFKHPEQLRGGLYRSLCIDHNNEIVLGLHKEDCMDKLHVLRLEMNK